MTSRDAAADKAKFIQLFRCILNLGKAGHCYERMLGKGVTLIQKTN